MRYLHQSMRRVSEEIELALTRAGGKNLYGKPNFRFGWWEDETYLISNGRGYEHFRISNDPCWLLMKWEPAEFWGTPEEWEYNNREDSGLLTAGPYPNEGRYRDIRKLTQPVVTGNVLRFEPMTLSIKFVDDIFPMLKDFLDLSTQQKAKFLVDKQQAKKDDLAKRMSDSRELYRGSATAKQVRDRVEGLERWLSNPDNVRMAQHFAGMRGVN